MAPPVTGSSTVAANPLPNLENPFRLQLGAGFVGMDMGVPGHQYTGGQVEARLGESFYVHPQHNFSLGGVFRWGSLTNGAGSNMEILHFGLEAGYEAHIVPNVFSAFTYLGLGTNLFYSDRFLAGFVAPGSIVDNQSAFAMTLGGGITLGRGIVVLSGAYQPNFGLQVPYDAEGSAPPAGLSPHAYMFTLGLNLAPMVEWLGGARFPRDPSIGDWGSGIHPAFIADTNYTLNFGAPSNGTNQLRLFDHRSDRPMASYYEVSLDRPTDETHPFGFRFDLGVGEDSVGSAPRHGLRGDWYYLQQAYAAVRLPIHRGVTLRGGQWTSPFGAEVLEGPLNNQISRSFLFNYAQPFTATGATLEIPITEQDTLTTGAFHGFDNVAAHDAGISGLLLWTRNWSDIVSTSLGGTVGEESSRLRSFVYFLGTVKPVENLSFTGEYNWGHETEGGGNPSADWHAFSLLGRYDFLPEFGISARGEVFHDDAGTRLGEPQTVGEFTGTVHVTPLPWLRLRAEFRHDESSVPAFLSGTTPVGHQNTLALGAGLVFQ